MVVVTPTSPEHSLQPDAPMEDITSPMASITTETGSIPDNLEATKNHDMEIDEEPENDESEDSEEEVKRKPKKPKMSERRREQNKTFSAWLSQRADKVVKADEKAQHLSADDEALSIRHLMSKQGSNFIVNSARDYQTELFEKAKKQNIIAVLDTGSGKTLIAVLLLRWIIDQELEARARGKKPRISFFLVDSVTLVFQQFAVLESNLTRKIERFCGEMGCDLWDKRVWEKHFDENMVIVCTAEILYQCLMHSFVTIHQINLLIFDEAHHAKKNHAYARIIKDFYIPQTDLAKRPKVFGMTASPVDARQDPVEAAQELEAMLDCQIATAADLSLVRMSISRPEEKVAKYPRLQALYTTPLCAQLKKTFGDLQAVKRVATFAQEATSELGEWCADHVWELVLAEAEALKIERTTERLFLAEKDARPVEVLNADLARIRQAQKFVSDWTFSEPASVGNGISPKVLLLKEYLDMVYEKPCDTKCIVFVKTRYTARLLGELFETLKLPNLHHGVLIGTRYGDPGDVKVTFRQQILTLMKFRKGTINCLFATSIAEEGLDIPDCNLVVRFNLYDTLIQYIQSRGRARHANSKYIHMIEAGNKLHVQNIQDVRQAEFVMRQFCNALPADRLLQCNDYDLDVALAKESSMRKYTDPDTGATLTYNSSLVVLTHFVGCLPHHDNIAPELYFAPEFENRRYKYEVMLPEGSPIRSAIGRPCSTKASAKRSAAFEMCMLLRQGNHLDSNLMPTIKKYLPAMRNAHLALNLEKGHKYDHRVKPSIWERTRGSPPEKLYMTVVELATPEDLGRPSQPLALLTRTAMPDIPSFALYLQADKTSEVQCTSMRNPIATTDLVVEKLNTFTLRVYCDVFNKVYPNDISAMDYWFAPILLNQRIDQYCPSPKALVDWPCVEYVYEYGGNPPRKEPARWTREMPDSELENRFLVDPIHGNRRFFTTGVHHALNPRSPLPSNAYQDPKAMFMHSIIAYSIHIKPQTKLDSRILEMDPEQPVLHGTIMQQRPNCFENFTDEQRAENTICYVCPQPLRLSVLPLPVASMSSILGPMVTRLDSHLIALETCDILGLTMRSDLALEALTKDSDNTEEHGSEQINAQHGMGNNYERLEFLGDCFLKMATSISLFSICPDHDEFEYHVRRMGMICNKNLFRVALTLKLYEYVRSKGYARHTWYPRGVELKKGRATTKPSDPYHYLGDKTVADVCEALIGAALLSYQDTRNMDMAVKAVSVLVSNDDHKVSSWAEYYPLYTKPSWQTAEATASQLDLAAQLEKKDAYSFRWPRLLRCAFIHASYGFLIEKIPSYQRLEFLGDAMLDMVCIDFLFNKHPDRDPQWLTEHKMAMVSNKFLAALAVELGFHRHLRYGLGAAVTLQISAFETEVNEAKEAAPGALDYWTSTKNPPKCLSDIVESYIGAVFVDSEFDYGQVERFFRDHVQRFFEDMSVYDSFANNHPTTYLHNKLTHSFGCMNYRLMSNEIESFEGGPPRNVAIVMIHGEIIADGEASASKNAKVKASQAALKVLDSITTPAEFRMKFGCNCEKKRFPEGEVKSEDSAI